MKREKSYLNRIGNGLAEVLGTENLARLTEIARLRRMWTDIVGPMLAQRSEPVSVESSCLWIAVDHPAMAQQIRFLQQEIIEACFRKGGVRGVFRLRTRIRPEAGIGKHVQTASVSQTVSWQQKKRIARELRGVHDSKLRRAIFRARIAQIVFPGEEG